MNRQLQEKPAETGITVRIEKLVYGGDGLGRIDGQVTLVPYVLPGELVGIQPERINSGLLRGKKPELLEPAPGRVTPRCEYFGQCGGCHYQQAEYAIQVAEKKNILAETLQRQGGIRFQSEIKALVGEPWYYRNRIQLHFENKALGFRQAGSHEIWPITHCEISSPMLNEVIRRLQDAVKQDAWPRFLQSLEIFTNESEIQLNVTESTRHISKKFFDLCQELLPNVAEGAISYQASGMSFRLSGGSFFQVNRFLVEPLMHAVVGNSSGQAAIDLYSGVGLFSIPLARQFETVTAVERGGSAFRDLEFNAQQSDVKIVAEKSTAEEFLARHEGSPDLLVADPPRSGLGKQATQELLRIEPSRIVIVSCDPTTLARDLKALLATYELTELTMVDLFPQTYHIEAIAKLQKR